MLAVAILGGTVPARPRDRRHFGPKCIRARRGALAQHRPGGRLREYRIRTGRSGADAGQGLQNDFRCIPGERLRDLFAAAEAGVMAEGLSEVEAAAMAALLCWDGRMETDSVGASLYELTSDAMADLIFENLVAHNTSGLDEELDAEAVAAREVLLEMAKGQGINASIRGKSELKCGVISSVLAAMADPAA